MQWAPAESFDDPPPAEDAWRRAAPGETIPSLAYWIRIPIPRSDWKDPQLKITYAGSVKAAANGRDRPRFIASLRRA